MKKLFLILVLTVTPFISHAQLFEGGVFLGGSNYVGDVGSTTYINPNFPAVGLVAKYNYSPRITFKGTARYTQLSINNANVSRPISFTGNFDRNPRLAEAALGVEFSYFKYNLSKVGYTHTPYISVQLGAAYYGENVDQETTTDINGNTVTRNIREASPSIVLPFGIGYKMKLAESVGIAFETSFTYTFKDGIDGNNHDFPDLSFGNPNSDDWYVFTGISIVYAFGRPGCYKDFF